MSTCRFCSEVLPPNDGVNVNNCDILIMINVIHTDLTALVSDISNTCMVCNSCLNLLKIAYDFKVLCTTTETKLRNYVSCFSLENGNLDLVGVLERERGILIPPNIPICRICLVEVTDNEFLFINGTLVGVQYDIKEMLSTCLCEMNLLLTKEPVLCKQCVETLIMSFSFHCKCSSSKLNIRTENCTQQITQSSHQNFPYMSQGLTTLQLMNKRDNFEEIMAEFERRTNQQKTSEREKFMEREHISQKVDFQMSYTNISENIQRMPEIIFIKQEPDQESFLLTEEIKLEDNSEKIVQTKSANTKKGDKPYKPVTKYYFCKTCTYTTKRKACLIKHKVVHFPDYKRQIFKCHECGYTVKRQKYLDRHMALHAKGVDFKKHKCELCSFCTRKKSKLERHMTVHKDERETTMYKCSKCMFITKWKEYLAQHELTHNGNEEKKFKCSECSFSTNWRGSLIQHKVVHLTGEEALKFHCTECSFKTKRKDNLTKHMIRHMKDEDVRIFYCPECPFTSKYSSKLSRHLYVHKKGDDLVVYTCTDCTFQTRWKNNLSQHMRVHQNASEIDLFKCKECSFTTKWKTCLTEHVVMHKTGDESKEFKCKECEFSTKWKKSLNMHQLTHNADDAIKKFKCDVCEYKTYRSHHLKRHMRVHSK